MTTPTSTVLYRLSDACIPPPYSPGPSPSSPAVPTTLVGLSSQKSTLLTNLRRWVFDGQNGSIFLSGFRGHGKTMLVEHCLQIIHSEYRGRKVGDSADNGPSSSSISTSSGAFRLVRLNGLLQTDDFSACREIAHQLTWDVTFTEDGGPDSDLESDDDDDWQEGGADEDDGDGYGTDDPTDADISRKGFASKVHKPGSKRRRKSRSLSEAGAAWPAAQSDQQQHQSFGGGGGGGGGNSSFQSNMSLLRSSLRNARAGGGPVIFVLDELDAFASPGKKQSLLYHLLDSVGEGEAHLAVIGVTSKLQVVDRFERRVRSRSSQIQLCFPHYDFNDVKVILSEKLAGAGGRSAAEWFAFVSVADHSSSSALSFPSAGSNAATNTLAPFSASNLCAMVLRRSHSTGRCVRWFQRLFHVMVSILATSPLPWSSPFAVASLSAAIECLGGNVGFSSPALDCGSRLPPGGHLSLRAPPLRVAGTGDLRLLALSDLPASQVVVLLATKRIQDRRAAQKGAVATARKAAADRASRSRGGSGADKAAADGAGGSKGRAASGNVDGKTTTFKNILSEYEVFQKRGSGGGGGVALTNEALFASFLHLLEADLLKPAWDHTLQGGLQYKFADGARVAEGEGLAEAMAVHLALDVDLEITEMLRKGDIECSIGVRKWGLMNDAR